MTAARTETVATDVLEIAFLEHGPRDGPVALLLHGWPDDAWGMAPVAERLGAQGYRTLTPWLRGFGPTRFLSDATCRDGRAVALAQDAIDLLDRLGVESCLVVGHDWGARAAYHLAALIPERLTGLVAMGLGYSPNGKFETPGFRQARLWWYQWLMTTDGGAAKVRDDPVGFARIQWETWSPDGWFSEAEFERTSRSFLNADWPTITLHGYRSRWSSEQVDPRYDAAQARIEATAKLPAPTLMIVGGEDRADYAEESEGAEACFPNGFKRIVLDGVGHFPAREAPDRVITEITNFFQLVTGRR